MSLRIDVEKRKEGYFIVSLDGKLDTITSVAFEEKIDPILNSSTEVLVLDMEKLNYISSMGLRSIFKARKALKPHEGKLVATNLQPQVAKVFEIVIALPKACIFESIEEADEYFDLMQRQELEKQGRPILD